MRLSARAGAQRERVPALRLASTPPELDDAVLSIGQVSEQTGVSRSAIRFYERHGLLAEVDRTASGYRQYSQQDVVRLRLVLGAKSVGLSIPETEHLVGLIARAAGAGAVADFVRVRLKRHVDALRHTESNVADFLAMLGMSTQTNGSAPVRAATATQTGVAYQCEEFTPAAGGPSRRTVRAVWLGPGGTEKVLAQLEDGAIASVAYPDAVTPACALRETVALRAWARRVEERGDVVRNGTSVRGVCATLQYDDTSSILRIEGEGISLAHRHERADGGVIRSEVTTPPLAWSPFVLSLDLLVRFLEPITQES